MKEKIKGTTSLYGLLGYPIDHSKSPEMHNLGFVSQNLDSVYMAFNVVDGYIEEAVNAFRILGVEGFNVTMPHKEEILKILDEVSEEAKIIGAVNTVKNENGKLIGHNTDGKGFIQALLEAGSDFYGKKVVLIGAGGAARAIAIQLALDGVDELVIFNRTLDRAEKIINTINENTSNVKARAQKLNEKVLQQELKDAAVLINCTSIGMENSTKSSIISSYKTLHKDLFVADIVYGSTRTKLLEMANEIGCKTMNGLGMLLWQGALAFKIWTGLDMPVELVKKEVFNE